MSICYEFKNVRRDGKCFNDCYIRAIVSATGMRYDEIEALYKKKQTELDAKRPNEKNVVFAVLQSLGFNQKVTFARGTKMVRLSTFLRDNKGKYILYTRNHICYAENGTVFDTWDCTRCLLHGYFSIEN